MRRWILALVSFAAGVSMSAGAGGADDARQRALELQKQAIDCHEKKDWACFLENSREAERLLPGNPRLLYNLACAESLKGDFPASAKHLEGVIARKLDLGIETDEDLAALRASPAFEPVRRKLALLQAPVSRSTVAFRLSQKDLVTEGLAYDARTKAFFVSSVHHRKILRRSAGGRVADFVTEGRDGLGAVLAIQVDPGRRLLWACSAALPEMIGYEKAMEGSSALLAFDLGTSALVRRAELPMQGKHALNDLAVGTDGTVYATDSLGGGVYRLRVGGESLETIVPPAAMRSPQGIGFVPGSGEKRAFVADYGTGISIVDLATGDRNPLESPPDVPLQGIDGLVVHGHELLVTQNGIRPIRVARLKLDGDSKKVLSADILERNSPLLEEPTLGVVAGGDFYYIANPQWGSFEKDGTMYPSERLHEPTVLKVRLR